jgi:hypothetical protein
MESFFFQLFFHQPLKVQGQAFDVVSKGMLTRYQTPSNLHKIAHGQQRSELARA